MRSYPQYNILLSTSFQSVFSMKTLSTLFKKYLKIESRGHGFVYILVGYISEKIYIYIENCNSVGARAHKLGNVARFLPNFNLSFTAIYRA